MMSYKPSLTHLMTVRTVSQKTEIKEEKRKRFANKFMKLAIRHCLSQAVPRDR